MLVVRYQLPYLGKLPLGSFIQELVSNSLTYYTRFCNSLVRNVGVQQFCSSADIAFRSHMQTNS